MQAKDILNLVVTHPGESEAEISGEIPHELLAPYRKIALMHLSEHTEIPGFRKGHVPEKVLIERVGESSVLFEAVEHALQELYPQLLEEKKLHAIGRPDITLTKLAPGNPVGFKITVALMPTVALPDYKALARDVMNTPQIIEVTETEVADFITEIGKRHNAQEKKEVNAPVPELTDEYVKALGDFTDVADFKAKVEKGMRGEKEARLREKKRMEVSDKIIEGSRIPLPRLLIESELEKMLGQFKENISRMNLKFEDYLTRIKKTEDDLRKEWEPDAIKRAKLQLALNEISQKENIVADPGMINHEVEHLREHIKDADPERLKVYVESMLTNEQVFKFLESQADKKVENSEAGK